MKDKEWVKDFDETYQRDNEWLMPASPEDVKSFIRCLLTEQKQSVLDLIERSRVVDLSESEKVEEKTVSDRMYNLLNQNMVIGYNQALADLRSAVKKL